MLEMPPPDLVGIAAVAVVNMVVGFIWYAPPVLGNAWMAALGKTMEQLGNPVKGTLISLVAAIVAGVALTWVIGVSGATTVVDGALAGAMVSIGFVATAFASGTAYSGTGWKLFAITAGYQVVALTLGGAVVMLV